MSAFPEELGVYVTEQLACPAVPEAFSVQLEEEKVPWALLWKVTVPEGVIGKPALPVSVTTTVHTAGAFWATGFGEQLTELDTGRWLTFTLVV